MEKELASNKEDLYVPLKRVNGQRGEILRGSAPSHWLAGFSEGRSTPLGKKLKLPKTGGGPYLGDITVGRGAAVKFTHIWLARGETPATNVARGRPAFQSSTYVSQFNSVARKAVDGNCSGRWIGQNTCTHTKRERGPWWYVDLGSRYAVSSVVVKNREDCCGERLQGAEICVADCVPTHGLSNRLCGTITDTRLGSISTISCDGQVGRYVSVTIPGRTVSLALCEVEVYGTQV
ncbi:PREDICTED: fucolectin-like [Thamnophis sirtalis]|uniref:Fucolectin-like n=1 Tax=Thamnophis sirtalis TaxID=35019 RepID=A0A6I9XV29_9SAUR|nr:PREDICTED: fucolectin-like [Thamnophis sirtalis]